MSSRGRVLAIISVALVGGAVALVVGRSRPPSSPPRPTPVGRATVRVFDDGQPAVGRSVVFHDPNGEVIALTKTDKEGRAAGPVDRGSMVTVADTSSMTKLLTIRDVEPGDDLMVGEDEDEGGVASTVCTAMLSLPSPHARATSHVVSLGVGTTEMPDPKRPVSMPVLQRYLVDGEFVLLAEALASDHEPIAFAFEKSTCADGGAVAVRPREWSSDYRPFRLLLTGGDGTPATATGELAIVRGEDRFERGRRSMSVSESAKLELRAPRPLGNDVRARLTLDYPSQERVVVDERRRSMPEETTIDLKKLLPRPSGLAVDRSARGRPVVRWKSATGDATDVVLARVWWPTSHEHEWTIVGSPKAPPSFELPALPDELTALRPPAGNLDVAIALIDASWVADYRDVRRKGLFVLEDPPKDEDIRLVYTRVGAIDF
jgi:hypothetical protein